MAALRHNPSYRVQMFVDDELELSGKNIGGIPIYNLSLAKKKFTDLSVNTLLLAVPSNVEATREKVFDLLLDHPLKVKTVPSISALISGGSTISDLTDIKVEDLLGREPVTCNDGLMAKNITGKRVFVTGAGGSIGSELCRQIIEWNPSQLIMLDVSEFGSYAIFEELKGKVSNDSIEIIPLIGSVQDRQFVKRIFNKFEIDTTYHAAAYKHVPLMEQNVMQCMANNVFGTLNVAEIALASKVKNFVLASLTRL